MADPNKIAETLKAKAVLLIQREREVYALRLGRERMLSWLRAFERLSLRTSTETDDAQVCAEWTAAMIEALHFQTAAAYAVDLFRGELELIDGKSHAPLAPKVALSAACVELLQAHVEGASEQSLEPEIAVLGQALQMQRFMWFHFPHPSRGQILLVVGVRAGMTGAQVAKPEDDLINFTMLGRHLAVLLSNGGLVSDLASTRRDLQELFDHLRQAVVVFDRMGVAGSVSSRQAKQLFERQSLEGCALRDLLYPRAAAHDIDVLALNEWIEMAFATRPEDWATCAEFAPREVLLEDRTGRTVPLELEFRPLVRDGAVAKLMLLATDVSVERELQQAVRTHQAQYAQRMAAMRRLITGGTQLLLGFVAATEERLERCEAILRVHPELITTKAIDELFRLVHTIRGEARSFDLVELEQASERCEEDLNELRALARGAGHALTGSSLGRLHHGFRRARQALARECEMLVAASPSGALVFDQVTVCRSVLQELSALAATGPAELKGLLTRLTAVPLGVLAAGVVESATSWAGLERKAVTVVVEPRELLVPEQLARVLPGVLAHLVRNAIAHGIESEDDRARIGKAVQGTISIVGRQHPGGVCLSVRDDGRGLDVARIRELASAVSSTLSASELVFLPGLSTRASPDAQAGRGVGLDAVRCALADVGYAARLEFAPGLGTRFEIEPVAAVEGTDS